jgi:hypothetical protein
MKSMILTQRLLGRPLALSADRAAVIRQMLAGAPTIWPCSVPGIGRKLAGPMIW